MDQLSFDSYDKHTENITQNIIRARADDLFGCCAHYRACSDAKRCVISDRDYSNACIYKINLDNGNVFYGKNANDFDINTYNIFISKYTTLAEKEKTLLEQIIIYFKENGRDVLIYNTSELQHLKNQGFVYCYTKKDEIIKDLDYKFLKTFLDVKAKDELKRISKERSGNTKAVIKKEDVINWLTEHDIPEFEEYIAKFIFVYIPYDVRKYMFEIYHDYIIDEKHNIPKLILPRKTEPNFIKKKSK